MSFRVETTPNHFTDYEIFSSTRFHQLGQQFLSLINPNHGTTSAEIVTETETNARNIIQQPSDLCRAYHEQPPYYVTNQDVLKEIKENFLPHKSIFP
ncbi:hypothetical protein I4U23_028911 [Adineta vaga]|nr:hypothetical protein I4U23_028911 [Adineta vaga]